jgi:hypothetical protein
MKRRSRMAKDLKMQLAVHSADDADEVTTELIEEIVKEGLKARGIGCIRTEAAGRVAFPGGTFDEPVVVVGEE